MAHLERSGLYLCKPKQEVKCWNNFKYWEILISKM